MSRRAASLALAAQFAAASAGFVAAAPKVYRSAEWGLEFTYPDAFAEGRYKDALAPEQRARRGEAGRGSPFAAAIVLVEPSRLGTRAPLDAVGHRRHLDQARTETGYDRVIEGIIATFRTFAPGG